MAEKLVPLRLNGQPVEIAVAPDDFFRRKLYRKDDGEMVTYADAGYSLSDRYEDLTEYDGPRTKRAYEHQQEERRAERAAARAEAPKAEPAKAEAKKAD
jgi:hypothetical protein